MNCYCGNIEPFEHCCQAIINGDICATTPEQLMRSRYSAYATKNADYLYHSYAGQTRTQQSPVEIAKWASETRWLQLKILHGDKVTLEQFDHNNPLPKVHFTALYLHDNIFYQMEEISRFIVEDSKWHYLDGDVIAHQPLATPKRNALCLCQSGKKFKHCCAHKS